MNSETGNIQRETGSDGGRERCGIVSGRESLVGERIARPELERG
jgi:hypothetical protein